MFPTQVFFEGVWRLRARKIIRLSRAVLRAWHGAAEAGRGRREREEREAGGGKDVREVGMGRPEALAPGAFVERYSPMRVARNGYVARTAQEIREMVHASSSRRMEPLGWTGAALGDVMTGSRRTSGRLGDMVGFHERALNQNV